MQLWMKDPKIITIIVTLIIYAFVVFVIISPSCGEDKGCTYISCPRIPSTTVPTNNTLNDIWEDISPTEDSEIKEIEDLAIPMIEKAVKELGKDYAQNMIPKSSEDGSGDSRSQRRTFIPKQTVKILNSMEEPQAEAVLIPFRELTPLSYLRYAHPDKRKIRVPHIEYLTLELKSVADLTTIADAFDSFLAYGAEDENIEFLEYTATALGNSLNGTTAPEMQEDFAMQMTSAMKVKNLLESQTQRRTRLREEHESPTLDDDEVRELMNLEQACNDAVVRLSAEHFATVDKVLKELLTSYGRILGRIPFSLSQIYSNKYFFTEKDKKAIQVSQKGLVDFLISLDRFIGAYNRMIDEETSKNGKKLKVGRGDRHKNQ